MFWAKEVSEQAGCSVMWVYKLSRRFGRRATVEDIVEYRKKKKGRPLKYLEK